MDKLGEINLKNTVTVKVDCQLNEEVIISNFEIIMNCLKELRDGQDRLKKGLDHLDDRYKLIQSSQKNQKDTTNNKTNNPENSKEFTATNNKLQTTQKQQNDDGRLKELEKRMKEVENKSDKNAQNIIGNIKDICSLQKQMVEVKQELEKLKLKGDNDQKNIVIGQTHQKKQQSHIVNNINKEAQKTRQDLNKLQGQMEKMKQDINQLKQELSKLKDKEKDTLLDRDRSTEHNTEGGDPNQLKDLKNLIRDLKYDLKQVQKDTQDQKKQINDLHNDSNRIRDDVNKIKDESDSMKKDIDRLLLLMNSRGGDSGNQGDSGNNQNLLNQLLNQLDALRNKLKDLDNKMKDLDFLKERMNELQKSNKSKNSIEDSGSKIHDRGTYTQSKFHSKGGDDDRLRELLQRLEYLEKMMGSKHSTEGDGRSDRDKLPLIKRPKLAKDKDLSMYEKSSNKKDMLEIKNQLQNWLNNYLAGMKSKDNFQDLDLKVQELRNALNRKADHEGMKKGLAFLESKINQLYLFLTEPDGQDAMIVRKGFNCLSCSKKVEKLRGKIGPHINWNNMTATNYSPPKVGYSKHMGDGSIDKDEEL